MLKYIKLILVAATMSQPSAAQENLIINPDFDSVLKCKYNNIAQEYVLVFQNWIADSTDSGNWHECYGLPMISIPLTGRGCGFITTYSVYENRNPELSQDSFEQRLNSYISGILKKKLKKGYRYYAGFHAIVRVSEDQKHEFWVTNNLGMKFFTNYSTDMLYEKVNFIGNDATINSTDVIKNSQSWEKIENTFIADKNYNSVALGNFYNFSETKKEKIDFNNGQTNHSYLFSYYNIDSVFIYEVPHIINGTEYNICIGDSVKIELVGGAPYYLSNTTEGTDTITRDSVYWLKPKESKSYYLQSIITDEIKINVYPPPFVDLGEDTSICTNDTLTLNAFNEGSSYEWNTSQTLPTIRVNEKGTYWVRATIGSCQYQDTITIGKYPMSPELVVNEFDAICPLDGESLNLTIPDSFESYFWNGKEGSNRNLVQDTGLIEILAIDSNKCESSLTIFIEPDCDTRFFIPNAFTPFNGDSLNSVWKPEGFDFTDYELIIFNRYGEIILETTDATQGWDGTYRGNEVPEGVYYYMIKYLNTQRNWKFRKGKIHLLR